ncbi:hypothetical protein C8R42DRAFT_596785 [Lentinula raphanica]|nr:hypothetical protein C8R42DRAFT_596785 [Lentinula raphanica]
MAATRYPPLEEEEEPRPLKRVTHSHARRRKLRQVQKTDALHATVPANHRIRLAHNAEQVETAFDTGHILNSTTSGYLGRERLDQETIDQWPVYSLDELVGPTSEWGFDTLTTIVSGPTFFTDINDQVFVLRIPPPQGDETFFHDAQEAAGVFEKFRPYLFKDGKPRKTHRRGDFPVAPIGISYGGGQDHPKRIYYKGLDLYALERIRNLPCFNRLAAHASRAFAMWSPNLYSFYAGYMSRLLTLVPDIVFNWKDSIFACCTLNFGPQTTTIPHVDYMNYVYGLCAVTALGDFDFRQGGHLVLWDLGVVVEFPPGWTMLIPSAYLLHSNTSIGPDESRYSITQYTAAGLFRIIDDNGVPLNQMNAEERKLADQRHEERKTEALNRYTTVQELLNMD